MVVPSRYEGYGLTLTEAMTLGLPVVTSTADSLPELCDQYKGGFARCIDFNNDPDGIRLAKALSEAVEAGRSEPFVLCSVASMVDQYEQIYNELTGN
jgi:glycosyltransferase involved in cell wall biosynthesis